MDWMSRGSRVWGGGIANSSCDGVGCVGGVSSGPEVHDVGDGVASRFLCHTTFPAWGALWEGTRWEKGRGKFCIRRSLQSYSVRDFKNQQPEDARPGSHRSHTHRTWKGSASPRIRIFPARIRDERLPWQASSFAVPVSSFAFPPNGSNPSLFGRR